MTAFTPELDIVVWAPRAVKASEISRRSRQVFAKAARRNLHLALAQLPAEFFGASIPELRRDDDRIACLRSVLMKPEHREWLERIWDILSEAT
jgi:tyrosine decarboxylase/aspartate 1-decarboxylase